MRRVDSPESSPLLVVSITSYVRPSPSGSEALRSKVMVSSSLSV